MISNVAYVVSRLAVGAVVGAAMGAAFFGAVTASQTPTVNDCHAARAVYTTGVQTTDAINAHNACR